MAGVVAALSVVSDLARGHPPGEAMRACQLATELARRAGLDAGRQVEVCYGTLMRFAGCAATSHEIGADSHIQHIYAKIGCSTRGAAVLFALKHHVADHLPS